MNNILNVGGRSNGRTIIQIKNFLKCVKKMKSSDKKKFSDYVLYIEKGLYESYRNLFLKYESDIEMELFDKSKLPNIKYTVMFFVKRTDLRIWGEIGPKYMEGVV